MRKNKEKPRFHTHGSQYSDERRNNMNDNKQRHVPVCVKSVQIDGETLKADTWYKLVDGEFVEVDEI